MPRILLDAFICPGCWQNICLYDHVNVWKIVKVRHHLREKV